MSPRGPTLDESGGTAILILMVCVARPTSATFTDTGLEDGTTYFYRIRAEVTQSGVNLGGTSVRGPVTYTSYWDNANQRTPAE